MILGLQPLHWLIIIIVGLLLFAPSRLPELVRALKKSTKEFSASLKEAAQDEPKPEQPPAEKKA